jgi:hypothetical protein
VYRTGVVLVSSYESSGFSIRHQPAGVPKGSCVGGWQRPVMRSQLANTFGAAAAC